MNSALCSYFDITEVSVAQERQNAGSAIARMQIARTASLYSSGNTAMTA